MNLVSTLLLSAGWILIKGRREQAHKWVMLSAFVVSIFFLVSYLTYHGSLRSLGLPEKSFPTDSPVLVRYGYYGILLSHVVLAATVPVLTTITIYFGLRDNRVAHVRWARRTFPIWLYVSVTGVVIYVMLFQLYAR